MTTYIADRIAINPAICNGRPTVRGMRVTVQTVLEFLFAGTPREELLHQYPMLEPEDLDACQQFTDFKDRRVLGFGLSQITAIFLGILELNDSE